MRKTTSGFTIVEILVVIAIIGILATITFMGFGRYQADTRDNSRAGKATIIAEALEKYYDQNGEYPSCTNLTGSASTVTTSVLPGVETQTLVTPQAASGITNSILCSDLTNISQSDFLAYVGDSSSTCLTGSACLTFQLKYKQESTGQIITINSRRKANIAYSNAPTLSSSPAGFTQINMSWTTAASALSYNLVRATDNAFTNNVVTTNTSGTSLSVTGLAYNTTYYFRVQANSATGTSGWSNTASGTTWSLATPTTSMSIVSISSFTQTWGSIAHADTYTFECSTDGATWNAGCMGTSAATSYTYGGAGQGTTYYVRVQANSGSYTSGWSNTASGTTWSLATPVVSAVANSPTTFTSSWPAISYANNYNVQCSYDNTNWGSSYCGAASTAATSFGWGPTGNGGTRIYLRTQAVNGSYTSSWSASAMAVSPIAAPTNPGLTAGMSGGYAVGTATAATCTYGTVMYQMVYNTNDGGWSASWGTWSTTLPSIAVGASQGYKYGFAVSAICRGNSIDSAQGGIASAYVVDPIAQPSAPNYLWPGSYTHNVNADPSYSGNCPAGTWAVNGTFRDHFVGGSYYGPHPWGYVGSPWVAVGNVEYWGQNQCTTNYTTSPMSPESYNYLPVY